MTVDTALQPTGQPGPVQAPRLRRVLSFHDLVLYYVVTGFSLRWVAVAAAAGPSSLLIWVVAALGFFVPLVFCVLELSSRYPEEGGIYVWSKRAFGPFAAFITGWTYWGSNLPYLPGLLYYAAANALFMGGPEWQQWSSNSTYFIAVSTAGLAVTVAMNVVGLNVGKWLTNVGAIAGALVFSLLLVGLIMAVALPKFSAAAADSVRSDPWKSLALGFCLLLCLPVAAVLFMFTVIGIPLGLAVLLFYPVMLLLGFMTSALFLGDRAAIWIAKRRGLAVKPGWRYAALSASLLALLLVCKIPLAGCVISCAVMLFGLGAFWICAYRGYLGRGLAPEPSPLGLDLV
jgi:hypothetical protein